MKRIRDVRNLRTDIVEVLRESAGPVQLLDLSKRLHIRSDSVDYDELRQVLTKMAEEGLISRHSRRRYSLAERDTSGFEGVLRIYHESASVETGDPDIPTIFVRRQHLSTALDGDVVRVRPLALRENKKVRGEVVAVVHRATSPISGTLEYDGSFYYLVPDETKFYVDFLVAQKNINGAKPGDKVVGRFVRWEHEHASPEAEVVEVLGESGNPTVEFAAILKEFRLPREFPPAVEAEASACAEPPKRLPKGRTDLRKHLIITIDPDDARDFDDALSLRHLDGGLVELGVHIADVTHYVKEGTALDAEARIRGNSTYLVDGVVPMLPERLSNNLCSLVPGQNRFAFSVFMVFTPKGVCKEYRIEESVIHSKRRFTYGEVQTIIETGKGDHAELILGLHALARILNERRMKNGGIDFETQEIKFLLDADKRPIQAVVKTRTDATSLVEECMLAANRTVAEHIDVLRKQWRKKQSPPTMYRIHESPDPEKLADALTVVRALGIDVPSGRIGPSDVDAILKAAALRPDKAVINSLLLRAMSKAIYSEHNVGHFGLGFVHYSHFTSPIRRYPDLFVHRVLKEYAQGMPSPARWNNLMAQASSMSDHCSQTERTSVEAERASTKLAQVMMAREHVGESFNGVVTGITSFGLFVTLEGIMIEGLLHIRDLADDYYWFDDKRWRLIGRRSRRQFAYGTALRVKVVKADIEKRTIDLALLPMEDIPSDSGRGQQQDTRSDDRKSRTAPAGRAHHKRSAGERPPKHGPTVAQQEHAKEPSKPASKRSPKQSRKNSAQPAAKKASTRTRKGDAAQPSPASTSTERGGRAPRSDKQQQGPTGGQRRRRR
ncbi:MAG: ribonuclease R [Candidatus Kapabacteria bacterium]|nr:ribonuclease R [Candidatus Kapabacteria bacterium]